VWGFFHQIFGGGLKAKGAFYRGDRYLLPPSATASEGLAALSAVGAVAIAYFLAARLGLALLAKPSDVAVFWPASGIAAGILIISGRRALPAWAFRRRRPLGPPRDVHSARTMASG
jgi:hypothetical protein